MLASNCTRYDHQSIVPSCLYNPLHSRACALASSKNSFSSLHGADEWTIEGKSWQIQPELALNFWTWRFAACCREDTLSMGRQTRVLKAIGGADLGSKPHDSSHLLYQHQKSRPPTQALLLRKIASSLAQ